MGMFKFVMRKSECCEEKSEKMLFRCCFWKKYLAKSETEVTGPFLSQCSSVKW